MFGIRSFFKMWRIYRCARYIAKKFGECQSGDWTFDDGRLRICTYDASILIYYSIGGHERKLVFCVDHGDHQYICREGAWTSYFAELYNDSRHGKAPTVIC